MISNICFSKRCAEISQVGCQFSTSAACNWRTETSEMFNTIIDQRRCRRERLEFVSRQSNWIVWGRKTSEITTNILHHRSFPSKPLINSSPFGHKSAMKIMDLSCSLDILPTFPTVIEQGSWEYNFPFTLFTRGTSTENSQQRLEGKSFKKLKQVNIFPFSF